MNANWIYAATHPNGSSRNICACRGLEWKRKHLCVRQARQVIILPMGLKIRSRAYLISSPFGKYTTLPINAAAKYSPPNGQHQDSVRSCVRLEGSVLQAVQRPASAPLLTILILTGPIANTISPQTIGSKASSESLISKKKSKPLVASLS